MSEDCARKGKLIRGCCFRPRYDEVGATTVDVIAYLAMPGPAVQRNTPARKTYLCDVCETCGKTLFRRKPEQKPQP